MLKVIAGENYMSLRMTYKTPWARRHALDKVSVKIKDLMRQHQACIKDVETKDLMQQLQACIASM